MSNGMADFMAVSGMLMVAFGAMAPFWVGRRVFNRRGLFGTASFGSYADAVTFNVTNRAVLLLGKVAVPVGIGVTVAGMLRAYASH